MKTSEQILAKYRDLYLKRFLDVMHRDMTSPVQVPLDPQAALKLGVALGRREGYCDGLLDGTQLGLSVGMDTVDEIMKQPVIIGSIGDT